VFRALQLAGAAYLVLLGLQSLAAALPGRSRQLTFGGGAGRLAPKRAFRQGLLSNLGNPKIAVFFVSLLPQFVTPGTDSFLALVVLGAIFSAMGLAWLTMYAVAVAKAGELLRGRARRAIDAITGAVLVLFGLRLAVER
jgi:threonine/homoserine/homoserine lactone efflux protein